MKLASRIGTVATAGIVAWASVGAAQPGVEEQSQAPAEPGSPSAESGPSVSSEADTEHGPSSPEAEETDAEVDDDTDDPASPPVRLQCDFQPKEGPAVDVVFQDDIEYDTMVITIGGVEVSPIDGTTIDLSPDQVGQEIELSLLDDGELSGTCSDEVPQVPSPEPPDDTSDPETPPATEDPEPSETETPTPPPPEEPTTPTGTPTTDRPGSAPPPPTSQAPPPPPSTPQQTPPLDDTPQAPAPPPTATAEEGTNHTAAPTPPSSSQQTEPVERDIRQNPHNPRYLLSQLWGTDSHNGSRLIMPEPRDAKNQSPDLETLPPVSEDELNAIKARHAAPENGNGLGPGDELVTADDNEGLSTAGSVWLLSGGVCTVLVAAGIWWAISRRKPKH